MNAGKFTELVELQHPDPLATPDASGNVDLSDGDTNWVSPGDRWVKMHFQNGREFFNAQQITADLTHLVDLYYDADTKDMDPSWRLKMKDSGRYLNILSAVNMGEAHEFMRCQCKEVV